MQKAKGIFAYISNYSEDTLENHVVQGFMYRKRNTITSAVVAPKKKWFFLFSECGFIRDDSDELSLDELPPFINPNVMYFFDADEKDSYPKSIHMRDIKEIRNVVMKLRTENNLL